MRLTEFIKILVINDVFKLLSFRKRMAPKIEKTNVIRE